MDEMDGKWEVRMPDEPFLNNTITISEQNGCEFSGTNDWYFEDQARGDTEFISGIINSDGSSFYFMESTVQPVPGDIFGVLEFADDGGVYALRIDWIGKNKDTYDVLAMTEPLYNPEYTDLVELSTLYEYYTERCEDIHMVGLWISDPFSEISVNTDTSYAIEESGLMLHITEQTGCVFSGTVRFVCLCCCRNGVGSPPPPCRG